MRQEAHRKVAMLHVLREQNLSEDQIAERLGFASKLGLSAAEAMYQWLRNLELPEWLVNPATLSDGGESNRVTGTKKPEGESERKAQSTGDMVDLPPAASAAEVFRWQIRRRSGTPPIGGKRALEDARGASR